jgi:tetratricopeptide (TPR) repeat protein
MVRNGVPGDEAFAAAFDADYDSLANHLQTYLRSNRLPWIETKAEIDLEKNLEIKKLSYAEVLYRLGDLLANQRPIRPERRAYFEAAVKADPGHAASLSSLAVEAEGMADWETALALHERASTTSPDDPLVLYRWGRFLSRRGGNHEHTTAVLTRSAELDPSFAPVWASLAKVYADAGVTSDEAVEAARIAHSMRPSDIMAARDLVRLYLRLDRRQEAVSLIEDSLRSQRRIQAQAWMLVIQQDLVRARELLQEKRPTDAMRRVDLAEQIVDRSINPGVARQNIEWTRRAIVEHKAAALFNEAQELFSLDDRDDARELLEKALALVDDGPVAASSRQLLDIIDHPERLTEASEPLFNSSPTPSEIEHFNQLIARREFGAALVFLEGMRGRLGVERQEWLDDRIREIRRTIDYNRYIDEYNRAVDLYNQKQYGEAVRVLETLLATLPEGRESESARALLKDALRAQK